VTKPPSTTVEDVANMIPTAVARATKAVREVSDAIAELRDAETMLKGLAASQMFVENRPTAGENRKPPLKDANPRLAYPIPEVARKLGLHRRTIEYKIQAGKLEVVEFFGKRLVTAESLSAALEKVPPGDGREHQDLCSNQKVTSVTSDKPDQASGPAIDRNAPLRLARAAEIAFPTAA
jgi:hypothetical protein